MEATNRRFFISAGGLVLIFFGALYIIQGGGLIDTNQFVISIGILAIIFGIAVLMFVRKESKHNSRKMR